MRSLGPPVHQHHLSKCRPGLTQRAAALLCELHSSTVQINKKNLITHPISPIGGSFIKSLQIERLRRQQVGKQLGLQSGGYVVLVLDI